MIHFPMDTVKTFEIKDLHKKLGRIIVIEPGDSDFQEGYFKIQVWFQCEDGKIYLLDEK